MFDNADELARRGHSETIGILYGKMFLLLQRKSTLQSLNTFRNNNLDIPFSDIDISWLIQFENWLLDRGYTETSASLRFRTLPSAFNKAIERKVIRKDIYPFVTFVTFF